MLGTRLTRTALAAALCAVLLVSGCGDDPGPLTLDGDSFTADPRPDGLWFNVRGCLRDGEDDPVDVMITKIVPTQVRGPQEADVRVAWEPSPDVTDVIGSPGEPPAEYRPFSADRHSGGTLVDCSLGIGVVLRAGADERVGVRGLDVTYEVAGETFTAHAPVDVALCPAGAKAGSKDCR